jgi:hypothetical protein
MKRQTDEPNFVTPKIVHTLFFLVVEDWPIKQPWAGNRSIPHIWHVSSIDSS